MPIGLRVRATLAFEDYVGQSLVGGVSQREGDVFCAEAGGDGGGLSVELNGWALAFGTDDFNVAPADAVIPPGSESFHARLLWRQSGQRSFRSVQLWLRNSGSRFR